MKNVIAVLLAVTAISLLVFASKTYSGGSPDFLYQTCVDLSDRAMVRTMRNMCDNDATGLGYNVGIFRPFNAHTDGVPLACKEIDPAVFVCLGAPHQEEACKDEDCN